MVARPACGAPRADTAVPGKGALPGKSTARDSDGIALASPYQRILQPCRLVQDRPFCRAAHDELAVPLDLQRYAGLDVAQRRLSDRVDGTEARGIELRHRIRIPALGGAIANNRLYSRVSTGTPSLTPTRVFTLLTSTPSALGVPLLVSGTSSARKRSTSPAARRPLARQAHREHVARRFRKRDAVDVALERFEHLAHVAGFPESALLLCRSGRLT